MRIVNKNEQIGQWVDEAFRVKSQEFGFTDVTYAWWVGVFNNNTCLHFQVISDDMPTRIGSAPVLTEGILDISRETIFGAVEETFRGMKALQERMNASAN